MQWRMERGGNVIKRIYATCIVLSASAFVLAQDTEPDNLSNVDIEDLTRIEVVSAAKRPQELMDAAASIYVITAEDIRRSGVQSVPEALKLAPGVHVSRIEANKWSVSIGGFSSRYADKLLVMVDGRSVYTPLFSGVYWDAQDLMLERVERIEVIRGPGGTLWGANAVAGVINIITKNARNTLGTSVSITTGSETKYQLGVMHGEKIGDNGYLRIHARAKSMDSLVDRAGNKTPDSWNSIVAGLRFDKESANEEVFLSANVSSAHIGQHSVLRFNQPPFAGESSDRFPASEWNLQGKWLKRLKDSAYYSLSAFYSHSDREDPEIAERRDTIDLEWQHQLSPIGSHSLTYGLGYRRSSDETKGTPNFYLTRPSQTDQIYGGFVRDEITLGSKTKLLLGVKLDHNDYTGWEAQPDARIIHRPDDKTALWAAVSKSVRTPSRMEQSGHLLLAAVQTPMGPAELALIGNTDFTSAQLTAYEAGARWQARKNLFIDFAAYHFQYSRLRTFESGTPFLETAGGPHLVIPVVLGNKLKGTTSGFDLSASWKPNRNWDLQASYSLISERFAFTPGSTDTLGEYGVDGRGAFPKHMVKLGSNLKLSKDLSWSVFANYIHGVQTPKVSAYWDVDTQLSYRLNEQLEFSLGAKNLAYGQRYKGGEGGFEIPSEDQRSWYVTARWKF